MWLAVDLEALAGQHRLSLQIEGGPVILSGAGIAGMLESFASHGGEMAGARAA